MEEKERFELNDNDCIIDNEKDVAICDICDVSESSEILVDLLNEQDKRIKELELLLKADKKIKTNSLNGFEKLRQENQQLKQQLEETEEERDGNYENYSICWIDNEYLKQQLEEKEKEIEQLKKFDDLNKTFFDLFRTAFKEPDKVDDLFNTLKTIQEKQDQDKISFAVEQLEKVKEEMVLNGSDYCEIRQGTSPHNPTDYAWFNYVIFRKFIDNQIKELGGKENE